MTEDPLRDLVAAQPGIATYPGTVGAGPVRPWIPLSEIALRGAVRPAERQTPTEAYPSTPHTPTTITAARSPRLRNIRRAYRSRHR